MNKEEAKEKIKKLIEKYENVKDAGRLKLYKEEETKNSFIIPLFEVLGWDFSNKDEVSAEETISGQRVDYGFYIDGRIKFYLETKKISSDILREDFANQAIRYSWNKGAIWATLTNFESIIIFNAQDIERKLAYKLYFEIPYTQYLERFDQLWLLSKESFKNDALDNDAEMHGKKFQKIPVTSLLYEDLKKCREILTGELGQMNEKVNPDLLDEGVQKILDRLIFIRVAEDRGIEGKTLIPLARQARSGDKKIYESMVEKFREFDSFYNSNLFLPHPFEQWEEYSGVTEKVISILYGREGYYEYDFKAMPADVLGAVYENYLGYRLSQSKKGITVAKDAKKRKEHGIYYTPSFIVDYIVKNALGPVLDKCKSISDLQKIKVLDPACGSGSFLIRAMDLIFEKYKDFGSRGNEELVKVQILENNIYGVDLDQQAVEITRLNLLINTLNERMKLPLLENIKNGNSLISGADEELEKYFGRNFREKKPFNWQEEFPEVFKQGGFDVIIGNPPYVSYYSRESARTEEIDKELEMWRNKFNFTKYQQKTGRLNLWMFFVEQSINLLREGGILAFIVDVNFTKDVSKDIRRYIIENTSAKQFVHDLSEFGQVASGQVILVLKKEKNILENEILIKEKLDDEGIKIKQSKIKGPDFDILSVSKDPVILKLSNTPTLGGTSELKLTTGVQVGGVEIYKGKSVKDYFYHPKWDYKNIFPSIKTKSVQRYSKPEFEKGILFNYKLASEITKNTRKSAIVLSKYKAFLDKEKIFIRQSAPSIIATIGEPRTCAEYSIFSLISSSRNLNLKYMLALLNSKLFTYYSIKKGIILAKKGTQPQIRKSGLGKLPIKQISIGEQKVFINLVDKMLKLNREIPKIPENSNEWNLIKSEIEKTDKKIDEEVYKLYGLTQEEVKIIEEGGIK